MVLIYQKINNKKNVVFVSIYHGLRDFLSKKQKMCFFYLKEKKE